MYSKSSCYGLNLEQNIKIIFSSDGTTCTNNHDTHGFLLQTRTNARFRRRTHAQGLNMKLVATFHGPTSVSHSITCNLTNDEDIEYLIVARTSVLEAFAILPESLSLQCTFEVWGRISSLKALTYEVHDFVR